MSGRARWLNWLERPAYYLDLYRTVPRAVLAACGLMTWRVTDWYMALTNPSGAQATFVSVVYATIPLILNFYCQNGVQWAALRAAHSGAADAPQISGGGAVGA